MAPRGESHPAVRLQDAIRTQCDRIAQGPVHTLVRGIQSNPLFGHLLSRVPHAAGTGIVPSEAASAHGRQGRAMLPAQHPLQGCFARIDAGGIRFRPRPVYTVAAAPAPAPAPAEDDDDEKEEEDKDAVEFKYPNMDDLSYNEKLFFKGLLHEWREKNTKQKGFWKKTTEVAALSEADVEKLKEKARRNFGVAEGMYNEFTERDEEKYKDVLPSYQKKDEAMGGGPPEPDADDPDLYVDADAGARQWLEDEQERAAAATQRKAKELRALKTNLRAYDLLPKLSGVSVYSVTHNNEVVLVQGQKLEASEEGGGGGEGGRKRQLGMFFMRRKDAQDFLQKVQRSNPLLAAEVTETTLDEVVSLSDKTRANEEVAWRIMPDHREVVNALTVSAMQGIRMQVDGVPVFQAQNLTVTSEDGTTLLPLFFTKRDLMEAWATVQKNVRSSEARAAGDLEKELPNPKVEVGTLEEVIRSMRTQVDVDAWSKVVLIPPGSAAYQDELTGEDTRTGSDRPTGKTRAMKTKGWMRGPSQRQKKAARAAKLDKKKAAAAAAAAGGGEAAAPQ